jgi:hypothetical protein
LARRNRLETNAEHRPEHEVRRDPFGKERLATVAPPANRTMVREHVARHTSCLPSRQSSTHEIRRLPAKAPLERKNVFQALAPVRAALRLDVEGRRSVDIPAPRIALESNSTRDPESWIVREGCHKAFHVAARERDVRVDLDYDLRSGFQSAKAEFEEFADGTPATERN